MIEHSRKPKAKFKAEIRKNKCKISVVRHSRENIHTNDKHVLRQRDRWGRSCACKCQTICGISCVRTHRATRVRVSAIVNATMPLPLPLCQHRAYTQMQHIVLSLAPTRKYTNNGQRHSAWNRLDATRLELARKSLRIHTYIQMQYRTKRIRRPTRCNIQRNNKRTLTVPTHRERAVRRTGELCR